MGNDLEKFRTREHALLEASVQEIDVVTKKLVDCLHLSRFELALELAPIRLEHLKGREGQNLLDERKHPGAEQEDAFPPIVEVRMPVILLQVWRAWFK